MLLVAPRKRELPISQTGIGSWSATPPFLMIHWCVSSYNMVNGEIWNIAPIRRTTPAAFVNWLWVKHAYPKWNPGKWSQRLKHTHFPWWSYVDPYPTPVACLLTIKVAHKDATGQRRVISRSLLSCWQVPARGWIPHSLHILRLSNQQVVVGPYYGLDDIRKSSIHLSFLGG